MGAHKQYRTAILFSMPETNEQAQLVRFVSEKVLNHGFILKICSLTKEKLKNQGIDLPLRCSKDDLIEADFVISIGGDGTVLKASHHVELLNKPILAINAGRLGFLADINQCDIDDRLIDVKEGTFSIEERSVLQVNFQNGTINELHLALNEISIHKQGRASLLTINTSINGEYLCSFWSDGIIIATPTGSTAYSLSIGGPIISPNTNALIINPIAPHTLSIRPIIIPDDSVIILSVSGRSKEYDISYDSDQIMMNTETDITIRKADYPVKFLKFDKSSYFSNLREKLNWGTDIRN